MAVYSTLYNYTIDNFEPIGEEGIRTWEALKTILENANNSQEKPLSSRIELVEETTNWTQDENNKNNVYKLIRAEAGGVIEKYNIYLGENYPEGTIITDINNNYRESFSNGEKFKISIPIKELKENGTIDLKIIGNIKTNPIYIGESLDKNNQDYAITKIETEEGTGEKTIKYSDNKTSIKIIKKDEEGNTLKNAYFNLFDENKNLIMSELATNEEGEININDILPGRYYIKETNAPEGYENYDQFIQIDVKFNEEITAIVRNSKEEDNTTVEINRNSIEVSTIKPQIKLPKTGM